MPTPFLQFDFNAASVDTDLNAYVKGGGEIGGAWAMPSYGSNPYGRFGGSVLNVLAATGRVYATNSTNNSNTSGYLDATLPPTADYSFEGDLDCVTAAGSAYVLARFNGANATGYQLQYSNGSGWAYKTIAGESETVLTPSSGSAVASSLTAGQSVHVKHDITGHIHTVTLSGAQSGTWSYVDSTYTAAGQVGIGYQGATSSTTGVQWTAVKATDLGVPSLTATGPGSTALPAGSTYYAGGVVQGASTSLSFTLTNPSGGRSLALKAITYTGCTATSDPSNTPIAVNGSATIRVTIPTATLGTNTGSISIASDGPVSPFVINLNWTVVTCNPAAPAGNATGFTVSGGASYGDCATPSATFTVAINPASPACSVPINLWPSDGGQGGTFTPPVLSYGTSLSSGAFTYQNPLVGNYTFTFTNDSGLPNPSPIAYANLVQIGRCTTDGVSTTPDFGGYQWGNVGHFAELFRAITNDPVDPHSAGWLSYFLDRSILIETDRAGTDPLNQSGIPFNVIDTRTMTNTMTINFGLNITVNDGTSATYTHDSDAHLGDIGANTTATYPIPTNVSIEAVGSSDAARAAWDGNADNHIIVFDRYTGLNYELWRSTKVSGQNTINCANGAIFNFDPATGGQLRAGGRTSGDLAGLPIGPLLVRYDEAVLRGVIKHCLRYTLDGKCGPGFVYPARHNLGLPQLAGSLPVGSRIRLTKAYYDAHVGNYTGAALAIFQCMRDYGLILADSGLTGHIGGCPDSRWDMANLATLNVIKFANFETVQVIPSTVLTGPDTVQLGVPAIFRYSYYPPGDTDAMDSPNYVNFQDNHGFSVTPSFTGSYVDISYTPTVKGVTQLRAYDTVQPRYPVHDVGQPSLVVNTPRTNYMLGQCAVYVY